MIISVIIIIVIMQVRKYDTKYLASKCLEKRKYIGIIWQKQ